MLTPYPQQQPPAEFCQQMATLLTQRLIDELTRIAAPPELSHLALSLSYFQDPRRSPNDLSFFLTQATHALVATGGL